MSRCPITETTNSNIKESKDYSLDYQSINEIEKNDIIYIQIKF